MGRDAAGVIGIRLARKGDQVVGMGVVQPETRPARADRDRLRQARPARPSSGASTAAARASAHRARGPQDRATWPPSSWSPRRTRSCCSSAPAARSCAPTSRASTATGERARRHRDAPQRGRRGRRHRRLPRRAGGAATAWATMTTPDGRGPATRRSSPARRTAHR